MPSNVLIVEDDAYLNNLIGQSFKVVGFLVHKANTLAKSIKILSSHRIDVVVFDLEVSDAKHIEPIMVVECLLKDCKNIHLILTTWSDPTELPSELHQHVIMQKPLSLRRIVQIALDERYLPPMSSDDVSTV
jgi:DNA-binding NtrC family response regulator